MSSSRHRNVRSPSRREALNEQLNEHTQRIRDLMAADITFLEEQNNTLRIKCLKVEELQEKVALVVRHNEELFSENQKLALLVEDKIAQCEHLRSRRVYDSAQQYEKNRLIAEVEELRKELAEIQHIKNLTIKQIRTKHQVEMKNLAIQHETDMKIYDEQLIKIRDELGSKANSLAAARQKVKEKEEEFEKQLKKREEKHKSKIQEIQENQRKVKQQNEKNQKSLQDRIQVLEKERDQAIKKIDESAQEAKDLQQKQKGTVNELEEKLKDLQKKHQGVVGQLENEKQKIQEKFNERISELQLEVQESHKKQEERKSEVYRMRRDNQSLRSQIKQLSILNEEEVKSLKESLDRFHGAEIDEICHNHLTHKEYLEKQLRRMEDLLKLKEIQVIKLTEDKLAMRNIFVDEGKQIKEDFKMLQYEFKIAEDKYKQEKDIISQELVDLQIKYRDLKDEFDDRNNQYSQIFNNHNSLKNQLKNLEKISEQREKRSKQSIAEWKDSFFNSKTEIQRLREEWETQRNTWIKEKQELTQKYEETFGKHKEEYKKLERQNESLKDFIGNRDRGIDELIDKITELNKMIEQRDDKIEKLREQLLENAKKFTGKLGEQKANMDKNYKQKVKYITEDFQTRNTILETNLDIALKELKAKQGQLEQLIHQYEMMRTQMIALTEQEAKKKNVTLKFSGATADLIATKNMFDVFVKGKVLQTCGEALKEKENMGRDL